jgi:WD40 repeat protein
MRGFFVLLALASASGCSPQPRASAAAVPTVATSPAVAGSAAPAPAPEEAEASTPPPGIELRSIAWSPDGMTVAVGAFGVTIVVDSETRRELSRLTDDSGWHHVSFLPDGRVVTQGSHDTVPARWRAVLWEARSGKTLEALGAPAACATDSELGWGCRPDGTGFRSHYDSYGKRIIVQAWDGAQLRPAWEAHDRPPLSRVIFAVAPSGAAALAGADGYSATQTEPTLVHTNEQTGAGPLRRYYYEQTPKLVGGGFVRVFESGSVRCEQLGIGQRITSVVFARDGSSLLAGDASGKLFVLSASCQLTITLEGGNRPIVGVALGPGRAAAIDEAGALRWWKLGSGERAAADSFQAS